MHAISSYLGKKNHPPTNKQADKHTQSQTNRQDRLQYTVLQLARSVTKIDAIVYTYEKLAKFMLTNS